MSTNPKNDRKLLVVMDTYSKEITPNFTSKFNLTSRLVMNALIKERHSLDQERMVSQTKLIQKDIRTLARSVDICPYPVWQKDKDLVYDYKTVVVMGLGTHNKMFKRGVKQFPERTLAKRKNGTTFLTIPSSDKLWHAVDNDISTTAQKKRISIAQTTLVKAVQHLDNTLPASSWPEAKFCLRKSDVEELIKWIQETKEAAIDTETMPANPGVPEADRLLHNTTVHLAKVRMMQFSPQIGTGFVVPTYDPESPFNVGCDDKIEIYADRNGKENEIISLVNPKLFTDPVWGFTNIRIHKNGEEIRTYDGDEIIWEPDVALALWENWRESKSLKIGNYLRDVILPMVEENITNDPKIAIICHNLSFDLNMMIYPKNGMGLKFQGLYRDTMDLRHVLDKYGSLSLKAISKVYTEFTGYEVGVDYANDRMRRLGIYGVVDTDLTLRADLNDTERLLSSWVDYRYFRNMRSAAAPVFARMERQGEYVDVPRLIKLLEKLQDEAKSIRYQIETLPVFQSYVAKTIKAQQQSTIEILTLRREIWRSEKIDELEAKLADQREWSKSDKNAKLAAWTNLNRQINWLKERRTSSLPKTSFKEILEFNHLIRQAQLGKNTEVLVWKVPTKGKKALKRWKELDGKQYDKQERLSIQSFNLRGDVMKDFLYFSPFGLGYDLPVVAHEVTTKGRKKTTVEEWPTTKREELEWFEDRSGFIKLFNRFSGVDYLITSTQEILRYVDPDGFIHARYGYTNTDRTRTSQPNVQNFTKRTSVKENEEFVYEFLRCFSSFHPDYEKYVADVSMAELRWGCFFFRVHSMAQKLREFDAADARGDKSVPDLHVIATAMGKRCDPQDILALAVVDYMKYTFERTGGKAINFGYLFGQGWEGFMRFARTKYKVVFSAKEAKEIRKLFFQMYPELVEGHAKQRDFVRTHGYVRGPFGNKRELWGAKSSETSVRRAAEREAINTPVQSASAIGMIIGMVYFEIHRTIIGLRGGTRNLIHDDIPGFCHKDDRELYYRTLVWCTTNLPLMQYFGIDLDIVDLKVEVESGINWKDKESYVYDDNCIHMPIFKIAKKLQKAA